MALIKKDNFELVLEKATELGVTHIIPVQMDRSEKKGVNYERAHKIVREAAEQSGRVTVPILGEIINIDAIPTEGVVVFEPRGEISAREFFNKYNVPQFWIPNDIAQDIFITITGNGSIIFL